MKLWFGLEEAFYEIKKTKEDFDKKYSSIFHTMEVLKDSPSLKGSRIERILEASHIRDSLLGGKNLYSEDLLKKKSEELYSDIKRTLKDIANEEIREKIYFQVRKNFYYDEPAILI